MSAPDRNEGQGERATDLGPAEAIVALAQLLVTGADCSRMIHEAALATAMALGADRCEILRPEPGGDYLSRAASSDETAACDESDAVPYGVSSVAGYALLCGVPVVSHDLYGELRFGTAGMPRWEGPVSAVAASVPGSGDTFGVLVAYAARAEAFGPRHALSISRTASFLGGALERLDEREELRRRAEEAKLHRGVSREHPPEHEGRELTDRQLEVLRLLADGRPAKRIASDMGISIHTVHFHQRNLYRTLSVVSSTGAIKRARELGLL